MLNRARQFPIFVCFVVLLGFGACNSPEAPPTMVDNGSWYTTGFRWPHDGNPYETEHFIVYSDAASAEARRTVAEIGEELLLMLREDFGIEGDTLFRFPSGQTKIHIFAYKDHTPTEWGGQSYHGGFLIYSLDHPDRTEWGHTEMDMYVPVVKHELMHVIEGLLIGTIDLSLVDEWFTEGIAESVSGGTAGGSITSLAKFEEVIADFGELNPIAMHHQSQYPNIEGVAYFYYYPMFELAVNYLLDPAGAGVEKPDFRDIYLDVRDGETFAIAFENCLGISLTEYESDFFELMRDFLH